MIGRPFFQRDPLTCARELIGCELVWEGCAGIIVETEAYSAIDDEASHLFMRPSIRKFAAIHQPGTAYVYLNYGVHWLLNVLVKGGAEDGFVLFRALEPTLGVEEMMQRRGLDKLTALCSGPGKLTQSLAVTGDDDTRDFCASTKIGFRQLSVRPSVVADLRIGISKSTHLPWRFLIPGNPHVSVPYRAGKAAPRREAAALPARPAARKKAR